MDSARTVLTVQMCEGYEFAGSLSLSRNDKCCMVSNLCVLYRASSARDERAVACKVTTLAIAQLCTGQRHLSATSSTQ